MAQFAQTARNKTGLGALLAELARVVDEMLQPEHAGIALFDASRTKAKPVG